MNTNRPHDETDHKNGGNDISIFLQKKISFYRKTNKKQRMRNLLKD